MGVLVKSGLVRGTHEDATIRLAAHFLSKYLSLSSLEQFVRRTCPERKQCYERLSHLARARELVLADPSSGGPGLRSQWNDPFRSGPTEDASGPHSQFGC